MLQGILLINLLSRTFAVLAKDFADEMTGLEVNLQNEMCLKTDVLSETRSRVNLGKGKASEKKSITVYDKVWSTTTLALGMEGYGLS